MIANYFKIALRSLLKNKLFSLINIAGMGISLASCLLIGLFVWDELQYDNYHPQGDRTYRVYNISTSDDGAVSYLPIVPLPFADYMQKDFHEIEQTLRVMDTYGEQLFDVGGKKIMESHGIYAEPAVFDFLTIRLTAGMKDEALQKPNMVALSEELAVKYFSDGNALGKSMRIGNGDYIVSAVFTKPDKHSHLDFNYIVSFATVSKNFTPQLYENWQYQQYFTYVQLRPGTDASALEAKFLPFVEKYAYPEIKPVGFTYVPHLQNIRDIHLHSSNFEWEIAQQGNAQTVYILSITGALLLVIACLNFINLSTAQAVRRMKEVGVRKVIGAARTQLVAQFVSESVMITFLGLLLGLGAAEIAMPYLNSFAEKELTILFTPSWMAFAVGFCVLLGLSAGMYPAWYLSRFRPAAVLYNNSGPKSETAIFRHGLIVLQFMFSFFLIMSSMVIWSQNNLIDTMDMGFNKEQLVMIPLRSRQLNQYETTKQEFANHPNVISATVGFGIPGDIIAGDQIIEPKSNKTFSSSLFCIDHDFIRTMGMKLTAGRDFSKDFPSDPTRGFIINETAARLFGYATAEDAVGKPLHWPMWGQDTLKRGEVIGVVKDFHFKSVRDQMTPVVMHLYPDAYWKLTLKIKAVDMMATIDYLKKTYERLDPEWAFTYKFVDENYDAMYRSERKLSTLFSIFTSLAIVIACFGLFGLVEYSVNQRRREVGIRKVFGAEAGSLLLLLTRKYFGLLAIAFVIIIPISYWASGKWLSLFVYHIDVSPWMYMQACLLIFTITVFTVVFQSLRATWENPASVLKNE